MNANVIGDGWYIYEKSTCRIDVQLMKNNLKRVPGGGRSLGESVSIRYSREHAATRSLPRMLETAAIEPL